MHKHLDAVNSKLYAGLVMARKKLFAEAARSGTKLVFVENGKIVARVPEAPLGRAKKKRVQSKRRVR